MADGQILFSITTNVVSTNTGAMLYRGDILSDRGKVSGLTSNCSPVFIPAKPMTISAWTRLCLAGRGDLVFNRGGFPGRVPWCHPAGDLLSDDGYRVFGNLELVSAFAPLEDASDFGLDALFIVTDFTPPAPAPRLLGIDPHSGAVFWEGQGRVFQLERAADPTGPMFL